MMGMEDYQTLSERTLADYEARAAAFWEGTRDHDVSQNMNCLLDALGPGRHRILDFGCGPGRDLKVFRDAGHEAVGLDACPSFVDHARDYSGCEVLQQNFLQLDLPQGGFDGIFANASFFHVPSAQMPAVLDAFHHSLRPGGHLFMSNPRGAGEGFNGRSYVTFLELEDYARLLQQAGFELLTHYYRPPGLPRDQQPWLALLAHRNIPSAGN